MVLIWLTFNLGAKFWPPLSLPTASNGKNSMQSIYLLYMIVHCVFFVFCYTSILIAMNHRFNAYNKCYNIGSRGDGDHVCMYVYIYICMHTNLHGIWKMVSPPMEVTMIFWGLICLDPGTGPHLRCPACKVVLKLPTAQNKGSCAKTA